MNKTFLFIILMVFLGASESLARYGAGVLPYAIDAFGKIKILIGSSSAHAHQFSDFGGSRDSVDKGNLKVTAAREGCEELMFIFDGESDFKRILASRNRFKKKFDMAMSGSVTYKHLIKSIENGCPSVVNKGYVMYFVQIPYQKDLPQKFLKRKKCYHGLLPYCWNETVKLLWVDLNTLVDTIIKKGRKLTPYKLYKHFVNSFKIAYKQGVIATL